MEKIIGILRLDPQKFDILRDLAYMASAIIKFNELPPSKFASMVPVSTIDPEGETDVKDITARLMRWNVLLGDLYMHPEKYFD